MIAQLNRKRLVLGGAVLAATAAGCSSETTPPVIRNLDRPSEVAFACFGDMRLEGGDVVTTAQPMASCLAGTGEEDLIPPRVYGFVLQGSRGTAAVVEADTQAVLDSDPLTPGKNSVPITTLPVGMAADRSGCFMMTASASSCDLAALDVTSALDLDAAARISRYPITNAAGDVMRAKPRTVVAGAQDETIGLACPSGPTGQLYVAYPACHTVAVVDAASGQIQAGIQFDQDGNATVTDGAIECPSECGDVSGSSSALLGGPDAGPDGGVPDGGVPDGGVPDAGPPTTDDTAPRPVGLHLGADGRLYVASENSPIVTIIELDAKTGLPAATSSVRLDGDVGVTALSVSPLVQPGGATGAPNGPGSVRYLYAVATDRTVRVVDLLATIECDTQVDPRYLYGQRNLEFLSCIPVNGAETPPRRPGARSPGIHMPLDERPLDVAFGAVPGAAAPPAGIAMSGTFAFITTSRGNVYIANVDDDNYPDFDPAVDQGVEFPAVATVALALPHQLRDLGNNRGVEPTSCGEVAADPFALSPRLAESPSRVFSEGRIAQEKLHLLPSMRQVECTTGDTSASVPELSFAAPLAMRELNFPDWFGVRSQPQDWTVIYEGLLSRDTLGSDVDGPPTRSGTMTVDGYNVHLIDPAGSLCQLGVEPFDAVRLVGCDPQQGDGQCGLGETCFIHPDAPVSVTSGICLPADRAESLAAPCRDFLITRRQYSAASVSGDRVTLIPRKRVLRTTPIDGCTSDDQCEVMADVERRLPDPTHPAAEDPLPAEPVDYQWVCRPEPTRAPGPDRCVMACETSDQCEEGHTCLAGYCYESTLPSQECVQAVQRYEVRASDAFVAMSPRDGYLHNRYRDEKTGECRTRDPETDPLFNPLQVSRVPLRPPACVGDGMTDLWPNPCSVDLEQFEAYTPFEPQGSDCVGGDDTDLRSRTVKALRLQNQAFRFHLVDVATTGDENCNGDRAGDLPPFSAVYTGFELDFTVIGGVQPMIVPFPQQPAFPIRIQPAPGGRLWVLDEGDAGGGSGRVFTFTPSAPAEGFQGTFIQ